MLNLNDSAFFYAQKMQMYRNLARRCEKERKNLTSMAQDLKYRIRIY